MSQKKVLAGTGYADRGVIILRRTGWSLPGIEGEAEGRGGGFGSEVVHAGLEALGPTVEMEGRELVVVGFGDEGVEGLGLVDERSAVCGEVDESFLFELPDGFVEVFEIFWYSFDGLDGTFGM